MIGEHSVTVYPDPHGSPADPRDITCLIDTITIQHGRDEPGQQPEASTATIDLDLSNDPLPAVADIGSFVEVVTTPAGGTPSTRFVGRISDLSLGWDEAGEDTPNNVFGQMIATSTLADLGRRVVGDVPFPLELDGVRVARILELAGIDVDPVSSDPGTVNVLGRDIDARAALEVAQATADSAGGLVWQTRSSEIRYADSAHRKGTDVALILDACDILITPTWRRDLAGVVNKATVAYGVAVEGGDQPTVSGSNDASIDRYGVYDYSFTSELAAADDAAAMLSLVLGRNARPVWIMPSLPVDVKGLGLEATTALLELELHSLIQLHGMPAVTPASPTSANLWVEGWTETLAHELHEIALNVSGYCRTVPPPTWDRVDPSLTWDTVGTLTWDDMVCLGPATEFGHWADVAASDRWDTTDPAITWDTWDTF